MLAVQELTGVRSACESLEQTVVQLKQRLKAEEAKQGELAGGVHCMLWKHAGPLINTVHSACCPSRHLQIRHTKAIVFTERRHAMAICCMLHMIWGVHEPAQACSC